MNFGTVRVKRDLESAVLTIVVGQTGVLLAQVVDEEPTMITIEYSYHVAAMKMFIARELHRKIELLSGH